MQKKKKLEFITEIKTYNRIESKKHNINTEIHKILRHLNHGDKTSQICSCRCHRLHLKFISSRSLFSLSSFHFYA